MCPTIEPPPPKPTDPNQPPTDPTTPPAEPPPDEQK